MSKFILQLPKSKFTTAHFVVSTAQSLIAAHLKKTLTFSYLAQDKKGVVITARVHPGETQASWMMKGVIDYLTSDQPGADELRKGFVFKVRF